MTMKEDVDLASGDPAELERLYRSARADGREADFRAALQATAAERPSDLLLETWLHRLDLPVGASEKGQDRHWLVVIGASVALGVVSALLARGKPPLPIPGEEADPLFWLAWAPAMAVGFLAYLAWSTRSGDGSAESSAMRVRRFAIAGGVVALVAVYNAVMMGARTGGLAELAAMHLPVVCWAAVGAALCLGYANPARQAYAYLVKSAEIVLTGGIFFGAGLAFVGLTYGIFAVLGVELPEEDLVVVAAWGLGVIPLLALGSVYDSSASPLAQDWHAGLTRTLRILARLLLPLALGVLLVYVLWFIPVYFRKPFEEREVLIVYNVTILAIMVLLTVVVSGPLDAHLERRRLFRYAVLGLGALTLILNAYALAAVAARTIDAGLTPNRFAVIGWNVVTLVILGSVGARLWQTRRQPWMPVFRESIGRLSTLAAVWAVVLLLALPLFL